MTVGNPDVVPRELPRRRADEETAEPRRGARRLHRVRTVRRQQNMSLRTAARQLGSNIRETRKQEDETADLRLSELYADGALAGDGPVREGGDDGPLRSGQLAPRLGPAA